MSNGVPSILVRGRIAWILGLIVGVVLLIVGLVTKEIFFIVAGAVFGGFSLVFLILSLVTKGATD